MNQKIIDGLFDRERNYTAANREPRGGDGQRRIAQAH
jgi:hypothetical protein